MTVVLRRHEWFFNGLTMTEEEEEDTMMRIMIATPFRPRRLGSFVGRDGTNKKWTLVPVH